MKSKSKMCFYAQRDSLTLPKTSAHAITQKYEKSKYRCSERRPGYRHTYIKGALLAGKVARIAEGVVGAFGVAGASEVVDAGVQADVGRQSIVAAQHPDIVAGVAVFIGGVGVIFADVTPLEFGGQRA